ncbi:MAG: glucose-1-phosphate thymidylyltransferase [Candidatus Bathyarchaeota archaeon]
MKGLLLAGGHGTRLRPLTSTGNKHMLPIANKPMLVYGLEHLKNVGIKDICVILGPVKEGVVETLGDGSKYGVNLTYIDQPEPKGLAHAVIIAETYLKGEPFVMYLGDNLIKQGVAPLIKIFEDKKSDCVVGATQVKNPSQYGVIVCDKNEEIIKFVEKPKEPISNWALIGIYIFNDKVFDAAKKIKPSWRGELEITDTIQTLLTDGATVNVQKVQGWWKDTGKPEDLLEANQLILQELKPYNHGKLEESASLTNNVGVGKGTIIHNRTTIRGPVIIGENCEIGPNSYIGPYTSIGDNVTLINTELENSIVMNGTRIDCGKRIIDSLIGKNVEIFDTNQNVPKGYKLILGDASKVTL